VASREYGVGRILVVCSRCGFKYYTYALGDPRNRSKYSGPPTPSQALSGHGGSCPMCGYRPRTLKPRIEIMTRAEYEAQYVETKYTVVPRSVVLERYSIIEPAASTRAGVEDGEVGVA
jgi:hypothetical protein